MTQAVIEKLLLADLGVVVTGKKPALFEQSSRVLSFQAASPSVRHRPTQGVSPATSLVIVQVRRPISRRVEQRRALPPDRAVFLVQQVLDTAAEGAEFGVAAAQQVEGGIAADLVVSVVFEGEAWLPYKRALVLSPFQPMKAVDFDSDA